MTDHSVPQPTEFPHNLYDARTPEEFVLALYVGLSAHPIDGGGFEQMALNLCFIRDNARRLWQTNADPAPSVLPPDEFRKASGS